MSVKNTVYFVSDNADLRKAQTSAFKSAGLNLVGVASPADYLHGLGEQKTHGCLLIDATETDTNLSLIRELALKRMPIPVIALVPHGSVAGAVEAIKAGAYDVAEKSGEPAADVVKKAIASFGKMQKLLDEKQTAGKRVASLTRREAQVLSLMVQGKPNRKIADELGISPKTLDIHRANLMEKMAARTVADLCRAHLLDRIDAAHLTHIAG